MENENDTTAIKAIFNALKQRDDAEQIPSFETFLPAEDPKVVSALARRRWYKLGMVAAAVIGVAWGGYYTMVSNTQTVAPEEIVILIELPDNDSSIPEATGSSVFEWEASSDFLISDINP